MGDSHSWRESKVSRGETKNDLRYRNDCLVPKETNESVNRRNLIADSAKAHKTMLKLALSTQLEAVFLFSK